MVNRGVILNPEIVGAILAALKETPLTLPALEKRLVRRMTPPRLKKAIERLVREGRVYRWPPLPGRRSVRFSIEPPDPKTYLAPYVSDFTRRIQAPADTLEAAGIPRQETLAALRELLDPLFPGRSDAATSQPEELGPWILSRMRHHERYPGGLISLRELREKDGFRLCDKARFDAAILRLSQEGQLWLYRHDYPASLSETEREALVSDGQGNYYNGASLRD